MEFLATASGLMIEKVRSCATPAVSFLWSGDLFKTRLMELLSLMPSARGRGRVAGIPGRSAWGMPPHSSERRWVLSSRSR